MIAKHILRKPGNDNVRALGQYIADANHEGEKCLMFWHEGCVSLPEDYDLALAEIEMTQAMNTRCQSDKTYHLMVSFRPEDEARLTPEAFQQIELAMAEALGLSEHQRVCGVHKNTNHQHMHVAYNLIHPEKFTKERTYRDFYKLAEACRAMEDKFGLAVDLGMEAKREKRLNQRAAAMEAHSGEQSFQSFAFDRKGQILDKMKEATTWKEAHQILAVYGIGIKEQGNGFALMSLQGKETMKASALDRSLSKSILTTRFGAYVKPEASTQPSREPYTRKPIQPRSPERDQLYKDYQAALREKIAIIDGEKNRNQAELAKLHEQWVKAKEILTRETFSRKALFKRLDLMRGRRSETLAQTKLEHQERLAAIKKEYPWCNWNDYLKHQAEHGNKTALEVLRSRPESASAKARADRDSYQLEKERARLAAAHREKAILHYTYGANQRQAITAINRMALLATQEQLRIKAGIGDAALFTGYRQTIDNRGVVIFTLPHGGTIRDTGRNLHFSPDEVTREAVMRYALAKFGKALNLKGNAIERKKHGQGPERKTIEPHLAIFRESARYGLRTLSRLSLAFGRKRTEVLLPNHARTDLER